jgi:hypothetical protein
MGNDMSDSLLNDVWETLEGLLAAMEQPQADQARLATALRGCLRQLLEYPPARVMARAEQSSLPTRPMISWLVYEAGRLEQPLAAKAQALQEYWETSLRPGVGLIPAAPCQAVV